MKNKKVNFNDYQLIKFNMTIIFKNMNMIKNNSNFLYIFMISHIFIIIFPT